MSHSITGKDTDGSTIAESDGSSGYLLAVQLPFALGLGIDSYNTKLKDTNDIKLHTDIYNLFYQLPIPIINLIVGLGTGNQKLECDQYSASNTNSCSSIFEKGSVTQWYTSIGMPIIPFFDIHLSYRSITSKNIETSGTKLDFSGSVTGVGLAFNF